MKIILLPGIGPHDPIEQARVARLLTSPRAECLTCGKRFEAHGRRLGGAVGHTHQCVLGHDVRPVAQKGE